MHSPDHLHQPGLLDQGHHQVDLGHQEDQRLVDTVVHRQEEEDLGVADVLPRTMDMDHAHTLDLHHQDGDGDPARVPDRRLAVQLDDVEAHRGGARRDEEDEVLVTAPEAALAAVDREAERGAGAEVDRGAESDRVAGGRWGEMYCYARGGACPRNKDAVVSTEIEP